MVRKSNLMRQGKVPLKQSLTLSISSLTTVRLWCPTLSMRSDGISMQRIGLCTVENRDTETIFNAAGLDFDVLKASAIVSI